MKENTQHLVLKLILVLSILGIITSVYLINNHYSSPGRSSSCDFSENISCSLVNNSPYSEFLGVPVAIFGLMWFLFLTILSWKSLHSRKLVDFTLLWLGIGLIFIIYMIIAEIILGALCPFCTIVHFIIVIQFIVGVLLYKSQPAPKSFLKIPKSWFKAVIIVNISLLIFFNIFTIGIDPNNHDSLAKCLTEKGVKLYSSFKCGVCLASEDMLGSSMQYINRVECHPDGNNSQTQLCINKEITGTPIWILEPNDIEVKRHVGFLDIGGLKEFSGCE